MGEDRFELGSVFKILSFTLATEDHKMRPDEILPIGNGYKIGRFTIHEAEHMPATLAVRDVLALSSNIGTTQLALRSGPERQRGFLKRIGVLDTLHTELPETRNPQFPVHWGEVETATVSFGHGIAVSPLSPRGGGAVVVNGGRKIVLDVPQASAGRPRRSAHRAGDQRHDARPAALCRDQRHRQESRQFPAMTSVARRARRRRPASAAGTVTSTSW